MRDIKTLSGSLSGPASPRHFFISPNVPSSYSLVRAAFRATNILIHYMKTEFQYAFLRRFQIIAAYDLVTPNTHQRLIHSLDITCFAIACHLVTEGSPARRFAVTMILSFFTNRNLFRRDSSTRTLVAEDIFLPFNALAVQHSLRD